MEAQADPLDFLLGVMNDGDLPLPVRVTAAQGALPYCRAKIAPVHMPIASGEKSFEQWLDELTGPGKEMIDRALAEPAPSGITEHPSRAL